MANWFSDTWREITSGGKARTETYNRREPARRASSPTPRRASSTTTSTRPSSGGGGGGGGGGGRVSAAAARTPVRLETPSGGPSGRGGTSDRREPQQSSWRGVANPEQYGRRPEPDEPAPAAGARYSPTLQRDRELAEETAVPTGTQRSAPGAGRTDVTTAKRLADVNSGAAAQRERETTERDVRAQGAAREAAAAPVQTNVRELSDEEYLSLTPRQRAAVQYNTGLVNASRQDQAAGGTQNTESFLSSIDLAPEGDLDAYLSLDRAIGTSIIERLDDPAARQQSAEALRWARGVPGAAPQSEAYSDARSNADRAATAMMNALGRGYTGLGQAQGSGTVADALAGGAVSGRAGFGTTPRDTVIQQAFDAMIAADAQYTPEQVANGIANLNDINGTDVQPQEVWDFAKLRLDAQDMASLAGENFVLPVTDATIVPLSAADIRSRYGI